MIVGVKIMPLKEILDSQGRAVEKIFDQHGKKVNQVRVGRYVELDLPATSQEQAFSQAKDLAQFALCNPLIEKFEIEIK
jgi:phosphoribosylformylglycinamidine synthase subunit PurS